MPTRRAPLIKRAAARGAAVMFRRPTGGAVATASGGISVCVYAPPTVSGPALSSVRQADTWALTAVLEP